MTGIPSVAFWFLIVLGWDELGLKGVLSCVAVWAALVVAVMYLGLPPVLFVVAQVLLDIVLILVILGRDVRIR